MKKKDNNKNKKLTRIITLILCMMVTGGIVHAVDWVANADQVQFIPDKLKSTNVQDAIDEVYAESVDYSKYKDNISWYYSNGDNYQSLFSRNCMDVSLTLDITQPAGGINDSESHYKNFKFINQIVNSNDQKDDMYFPDSSYGINDFHDVRVTFLSNYVEGFDYYSSKSSYYADISFYPSGGATEYNGNIYFFNMYYYDRQQNEKVSLTYDQMIQKFSDSERVRVQLNYKNDLKMSNCSIID